MKMLKSAVQAFIADEGGVTAIEYGLIAAVIGVAMATAATTLGGKVKDVFTYISGKIIVPTA